VDCRSDASIVRTGGIQAQPRDKVVCSVGAFRLFALPSVNGSDDEVSCLVRERFNR